MGTRNGGYMVHMKPMGGGGVIVGGNISHLPHVSPIVKLRGSPGTKDSQSITSTGPIALPQSITN